MGLSIHMQARDLTSLRNFRRKTTSLAQTLRHISSGVKSRAGEIDGATLAINERVVSELQEAKAELRNIATRTALLQTLEESLANAQNALFEMREIAVSAGQSHLSLQDREEIEERFRSLTEQIHTISEETTFNGRQLLNGESPQLDLSLSRSRTSASAQAIQEGLGLSLINLNPEKLGKHVSHVGQGRGVFLTSLAPGDLEINQVEIRGTIDADDRLSYSHSAGSAIAKARAINASSGLTGVKAEVDINVYRGFDMLRGMTLDQDRWIKINGVSIAQIAFHDQDADGSLRGAINGRFQQTGVIASVDARGQLVLAAPDGRNITLELSDVELRNALGIRDLYGDDVNFSPDVDPPQYQHYGDIESVTYVRRAETTFNEPVSSFNGQLKVIDSKFTKPQDQVDYVFEVVKAGALGEALVRVKEEQVVDGTRDDGLEDYRFNAPGIELAPPTPNKVRVETSDYYGGSEIRVGLKVLSAGSPESEDLAERPEVEVFITSLDDPTVSAVTLGVFKVSNDEPLDLSPYGLDVSLSFPIDETRSLRTQSGDELKLKGAIPPTHLPPEHDYDPLQPFVSTWDGIHTTQFTVEVIESGHSIGSTAYGYSVDEPPAKVKVTAEVVHQGRTYSQEYRLNEPSGVYVTGVGPGGSTIQGGMGLVFPSAFGKAPTTQDANLSGDYQRKLDVRNYRYVGTEDRAYQITFTSDGVISYQEGDGGPSARVDIYEPTEGAGLSLLQSYTIDEVNADRIIYLGEGEERDGMAVRFYIGPSLSSISMSGSYPGNVNMYAHRYNATEAKSAVIRITKAGIDTGPDAAQYEYFYADEPEEILGSGVISKYTTLPDQTRIRSWVARHFRSITEGVPNNIGFVRDFAYNQNTSGYFESEVIERDGKLVLESVWGRDTRDEQRFYTDFKVASYLDVGNGLSVYFYSSRFNASNVEALGLQIEADVSAVNTFQVGDTFSYDIEPNIAREGDNYVIGVSPVDLEEGAKWEFLAVGPDWKPDDTYYADVGTGFDSTAFTLTDTLRYPVDSGDVLGEIEVTGVGRLEVGDQFRVRTRAFVGEVRTSGAYTNPAFPTDYVLTVTRGGLVSEAELSWERVDGLVDTEYGGSGTLSGLTEGEDAYLEEGVSISFHDIGEGLYLAEGDQVYVSVGRNLKYTFGGQVSLHSRNPIEINYRDSTIDRQLGKVSFTGSDEEALSPKFHDLSAPKSTIFAREESSLKHAGVLSQSEVHQAIRTIDTALEEVGESRAELGAAHSRLESQHEMMIKKVSVFSGVSERLVSADYAAAIASQSALQISLMSAPQLMEIAQVNALRVIDLINQPALALRK